MNLLNKRAQLIPVRKLPGIPADLDAVGLKSIKWPALMLLLFLILVWWMTNRSMYDMSSDATGIDESIWLLIILSMISYLLLAGLCWWLLQTIWTQLGLPDLQHMVSQFNTLTLCQQLSFFLASFALQLFIAMGCLSAIC